MSRRNLFFLALSPSCACSHLFAVWMFSFNSSSSSFLLSPHSTTGAATESSPTAAMQTVPLCAHIVTGCTRKMKGNSLYCTLIVTWCTRMITLNTATRTRMITLNTATHTSMITLHTATRTHKSHRTGKQPLRPIVMKSIAEETE